MLDERGVDYTYRELVQDPPSVAELRALFARHDRSPREALRTRDAKKAGLTGEETDAQLIRAMAGNPSLIERPILDDGRRAVTGRPVEQLLTIL